MHGWPDGLAAKAQEEMSLMSDEPFDPDWELAHGTL